MMKNKNTINKNFLGLTMLCCMLFILTMLSGCTTLVYSHVEQETTPGYLKNISGEDPELKEIEADEIVEDVEIEKEPEEYEEYVENPEPEEWPERVAFITIDDGPSAHTASILDLLYQEEVPAIFFFIGQEIVDRSPSSQVLMERVLAEGHYLGLHSMTHNFNNLYVGADSPARFVAEMLENQALIYGLIGHLTYLCRAPFGMMSGFGPGHPAAVKEAGINCIDWNVDSRDWENRDAWLIYQQIVSQVELLNFPPEVTIVFHEYQWTIDALPMIIAFLREHGYVFKTYTPGVEFRYSHYQQ